jgi:hypothetical protein
MAVAGGGLREYETTSASEWRVVQDVCEPAIEDEELHCGGSGDFNFDKNTAVPTLALHF